MNTELCQSANDQEQSALFGFSGFMFRMGLALTTFEQVRPFFNIQLSDYCFFLSLVLFLSRPKTRMLEAKGSGVFLAGSLILGGGLLSLRNTTSLSAAAGSLVRLFILFGLFAPLAVIHSKQIRKNIHFLIGGISLNCGITLVQAWVWPGIVKTLSINPGAPDLSYIGRYQGLTSHPNTLGLSAALGVLLGFALLCFEKSGSTRWKLSAVIFICYLGALLSGSRTVLAGLVPAILVFAFLETKNRRIILRAFTILLVIGGLVAYFASSVLVDYSERLGMSGAEYDSDYTRIISAVLTVNEIAQKPILGWGADYFGDSASVLSLPNGDALGTEFTLLRYWYAIGILGAAGFLALFFLPMRNMTYLLKKVRSGSVRNALTAALSCYVLLLIAASLHPFLYNRYLYVTLFLFAGFTLHVRSAIFQQHSDVMTLA